MGGWVGQNKYSTEGHENCPFHCLFADVIYGWSLNNLRVIGALDRKIVTSRVVAGGSTTKIIKKPGKTVEIIGQEKLIIADFSCFSG